MAANRAELKGLADARDTQLMLSLIGNPQRELDPQDAGTTMRFLTAYFAVSGKEKILRGSARMQERPIGILVDALRNIGAEIDYLNAEGYPPLHIKSFTGQKTKHIKVRSDVSSQFISALMMIAPALPLGLSIELEGKTGSKPYIEMTAALMRHFGAELTYNQQTIEVNAKVYQAPVSFQVESDWSAASYWFAFAALANSAKLSLKNLDYNSLQGDRVIADLMKRLGVASEANGNDISLNKTSGEKSFSYDFSDCPDLAQTVAVICAAKNIPATFTGLESLRIKETDRCQALQTELKKIGADFYEVENGVWKLKPSEKIISNKINVATYEDHRMAMAFAPLACLIDVEIENPEVVNKSYPGFWKEMKKAGFEIN
ncbi:MAG TPA: 3-phosphoshikimate 1-carboxyvinyltransferase [Cyclobacteriaceae bacterium]|nr:3-phosphoshikimate 1-carboxyvinyltransferase [Cyclobacteriaceae bacterium]